MGHDQPGEGAGGAAGPNSLELAILEVSICPGCSLHVIPALLVEIASGERDRHLLCWRRSWAPPLSWWLLTAADGQKQRRAKTPGLTLGIVASSNCRKRPPRSGTEAECSSFSATLFGMPRRAADPRRGKRALSVQLLV